MSAVTARAEAASVHDAVAAPRHAAVRAILLYGPGIERSFPAPDGHVLVETASADTVFNEVSDPWTGFDKVQHVTFSFLWVLGSQYVLVNKAQMAERRALPFSAGVSALLGLGKEYYDWRIGPTRYWSNRDLVADFLGIAAAAALVIVL